MKKSIAEQVKAEELERISNRIDEAIYNIKWCKTGLESERDPYRKAKLRTCLERAEKEVEVLGQMEALIKKMCVI